MINRVSFLFTGMFLLMSAFSRAERPAAAPMEEVYAEANRLFQEGRYRDAYSGYKDLLEEYPDYAAAYNNLGVITSMADETIPESIVYFMNAIKMDHGYAEPLANLGALCCKIGEYDKAETYLKRVIELEPECAKHYFTLGWMYAVGKKDQEKAVEYLNKSVELEPDYPEAYYVLGLAYIDMNRKTDVLDQITSLRMLNKEALARALEDMVRTPSAGGSGKESAVSSSAAGANNSVRMSYDVAGSSPASASGGGGSLKGSGTIQIRVRFQDKNEEKKEAGK